MELQYLKKVGEKRAISFYHSNIYNIEDLVTFYPYRYKILKETSLIEEQECIITAKVVEFGRTIFLKKNLNLLKFKAEYNGKIINVTIFNRAFLKSHLEVGKTITLIGKYQFKNNNFVANDIKLKKIEETEIIPLYHSIKGIKPNLLKEIIKNALEKWDGEDYVPEEFMKKYHFQEKKDALYEIHFPKTEPSFISAKKRLIYEELFIFLFKIQYLKYLKEKEIGMEKEFSFDKIKSLIKSLPFTLTTDQKNGILEGLKDLKSTRKMNRLILGDVGSGKTIVAIILFYANYLAGYQGVFLVPTEILAKQHFMTMKTLFKDLDINIELLLGSTKKEKLLEKIKDGTIDILVGTHALLNEKIVFSNLGFIVTDEQHRFGVEQREFLGKKANHPDMLFLSATPIPRTYALTIYGDMDTTFIKEKPKGRKDVITKIVKEQNLKMVLSKVLEEIKKGHQIYVVAPKISNEEESDLKDVNLLKEKFEIAFHKKIPISILHGQLKKDEKDKVMDDFQNKKTMILISTTVIEVGVDVKNATMMIIFNAERFGLATLHQLRGRVGRNEEQCYCYLVCNEEKERLKVLEESNDGFYISEKDFYFRGEGDVFGVNQSGDMTFKIANIKRDYPVLLTVKKDVEKYMKENTYQKDAKWKKIIKYIDFTN